MRKIKFRAWHKKEFFMLEPRYIKHLDWNDETIYYVGGNYRKYELDNQENICYIWKGDIFVDENEGCTNLVVTIDGSGNVYAQENLINLLYLNVKISGSGSYDGFANSAVISNLAIEGSGFCNVFAVETLNANINGSGSVNYKGNPAVTSKIKGSGKVNNEN